MELKNHEKIVVKQMFEGAEFFGYESRNKYQVLDEQGAELGYASEQGKNVLGMLARQFLGHWRKFDINVYGQDRQLKLVAHHPFRFYFTELQVSDTTGKRLGDVKKNFTVLSKKFEFSDGMVMKSPFYRIWRFPVYRGTEEVARIEKKWSGVLTEAFTDKDTFLVSFYDQNLSEEQRQTLLACAVMIDLLYFEKKA